MTWLYVGLGFLAIASWMSTILLVRAAVRKPYIGALIERSVIAVLLSVYGTLGILLRVNTDTGYALMPLDVARALFVLTLLSLLFVAPVWLGLLAMNRLGDGGKG